LNLAVFDDQFGFSRHASFIVAAVYDRRIISEDKLISELQVKDFANERSIAEMCSRLCGDALAYLTLANRVQNSSDGHRPPLQTRRTT
jgi:hypothetical protein